MLNLSHKSRINKVLHYIHSDLNRNLQAKELAKIASYSEQHFHRIFKNQVGESVNQYVRKVRLEAAANQLMFSPSQTVLEIAIKCGFQSLSSFSHAFKAAFETSPGDWRANKACISTPPYLVNPEIAAAYRKIKPQNLPEATFEQLPARKVAYIRHTGYSRKIKNTWQLLNAWAMVENIQKTTQLGLHHSNPTQTPLDKCRYVACIEIAPDIVTKGLINTMEIPGGLHVKFEFEGQYGELLPSISKVQEEWLPSSGLIATTTPAFVVYHKNHFLRSDERYKISFYLPVSFY